MKKKLALLTLLFATNNSMADFKAFVMFGKININETPQTEFKIPYKNYTNFVSGAHYSFAYDENNKLIALGDNTDGQLGLGHLTNTKKWTIVENTPITGIKKIEAGMFNSFFIDSNNSLWGTGENEYGQLGLGTSGNKVSTITKASGPIENETIVDVAKGQHHTLALDANGKIWVAGFGGHGALGLSNTLDQHTWTKVTTGAISSETIVQVDAGIYSSFALDSNGKIWTTGKNEYGELGLGHTNQENTWTKITTGAIADKVIKTISARFGSFAHAIDSEGNLWGVGDNNDGSVGIGTMGDIQSQWVKATGKILNENIVKLYSGYYHGFALTDKGRVWATGSCWWGCFGMENEDQFSEWTELSIGPENNKIVYFDAGGDFARAIDEKGNQFGAGDNLGGSLGWYETPLGSLNWSNKWEEIYIYDKDKDTDGDGVSDYIEINAGTNPNDKSDSPNIVNQPKSGTDIMVVGTDYIYLDDDGYSPYSDNITSTITFKPENVGDIISVLFEEYATEKDYDYLYIYNGSSTSSPLIATCNDTSCLNKTFKGENSDGSLTFKFYSDEGTSDSGWSAKISLITP